MNPYKNAPAEKLTIARTIYVRDRYGVTRQALVAGQQVEAYQVAAIMRSGQVVNPEDLPAMLRAPLMETKVLAPEPAPPAPAVPAAEAEPAAEEPASAQEPTEEEIPAEEVPADDEETPAAESGTSRSGRKRRKSR